MIKSRSTLSMMMALVLACGLPLLAAASKGPTTAETSFRGYADKFTAAWKDWHKCVLRDIKQETLKPENPDDPPTQLLRFQEAFSEKQFRDGRYNQYEIVFVQIKGNWEVKIAVTYTIYRGREGSRKGANTDVTKDARTVAEKVK